MARWAVGGVDERKDARGAENGQMWRQARKNEGVERVGRVVLWLVWGIFRGVSPLMGRMVRVARGCSCMARVWRLSVGGCMVFNERLNGV